MRWSDVTVSVGHKALSQGCQQTGWFLMCPQRIWKRCCDNLKLIFIVLKMLPAFFFPLRVTTKHRNIKWHAGNTEAAKWGITAEFGDALYLQSLHSSTRWPPSSFSAVMLLSASQMWSQNYLSRTECFLLSHNLHLSMCKHCIFCLRSLINSEYMRTHPPPNTFPKQCQMWSWNETR